MMPEGFTNRLAANWKMMLAIGELCGAGDEARASAGGLSRRADEASLGVELLRDIKAIFETGPGLARISSEVLVLKLTQLEGRPWSEMPLSGKPITQLQLAKLLKGFKTFPNQCASTATISFVATPLRCSRRLGDTSQRRPRQRPRARSTHSPQLPGNCRNSVTTAGNSQKRRNSIRNKAMNVTHRVTTRMAENSQCYAVTPIHPWGGRS